MLKYEDVGRPPGLVGDIAEWINETAGKPQPLLALGASLAYIGALGGRIVQGPCGERTNMYVMGVGPSCCGKEHARSQVKKLNTAAGVQNLMGGEDVTSDAAIEMELVRQGRVLYMWDEIGHMFGHIKGSQGGSHRQGIIPMLMKMYSTADKTYEGKAYADRDQSKARRAIEQPHVSLYGTTVPSRLYDSMDKNQLVDGWLGRCLIFETTDNPCFDRRRSFVRDIPEDLIERVRQIASKEPPTAGDGSDGDLIAATTIKPKVVEFTEPAMDLVCKADKMYHDMSERERLAGTGFETLWGRMVQNATKIALVLVVGCESSVIDEGMLQWSLTVQDKIIRHLKKTVDERVSDSQIERQRQRVLRAIEQAGKNGINKTELTRKTANLKARERGELVRELVDGFDLVAPRKLEGTRGCTYYLKKYAPDGVVPDDY